jgi:phosphate transport system protein
VLKTHIRELGRLVELAISRTIEALIKYDRMMAKAVLASDDDIDRKEVIVEEACIKVLSDFQPTGSDLRFVVAILKINNDLERIGDLAVNVAGTVLKLVDCERFQRVGGCDELAARAEAMVNMSLKALVASDIRLARQVIASDDEVDELQRGIQRRIEDAINRIPDDVTPYMQLDYVVRQLERIGDMATNIAEDVIYMVDGKIVRHADARAPLAGNSAKPIF